MGLDLSFLLLLLDDLWQIDLVDVGGLEASIYGLPVLPWNYSWGTFVYLESELESLKNKAQAPSAY